MSNSMPEGVAWMPAQWEDVWVIREGGTFVKGKIAD